jgi:type III pantothenate kinase
VTPDVVVDIGNTRMKWGLCRGARIERMAALQTANLEAWAARAERWQLPRSAKWVITGVNPRPLIPFVQWLEARGDSFEAIASYEQIGLPLAVDQPERVGIDRLLTALAAVRRVPAGCPVTTINVGTAMTIDYVGPDGIFLGGVILPGPRTMARSLRDHTAALPLVDAEPQELCDYCGKNTVDAIQIGIQLALVGAADEAVLQFAYDVKQPVSVFITGGGMRYFASEPFAAETREIVLDPRLTLDGVRIAAGALP